MRSDNLRDDFNDHYYLKVTLLDNKYYYIYFDKLHTKEII